MAGAQQTSKGYDYIVVGGGTAGCVLASRLTEDPQVSVLLLEAGPEPTSMWIKMPIAFSKLFIHPTLNWGFTTEPEPHLNNRPIYWPRGKTLGGCSAINGLSYIRGHAEDFEIWRQLGNAGWGWSDVLPYFKKSERRLGPHDDYHGDDGPMGVSDASYIHPTSRAFVETGLRLGVKRITDINGAELEGIGFPQYTIANGIRQSTAEAFLKPVRGRPNLTVETSALTRRILTHGRRAIGVEYERGGSVMAATARGEVLLAAGAINSPQLLLLSGIGPADHLKEHGINVVADVRGVGENLQDHPYAHCTARTKPGDSLNPQFGGLRVVWHGINYYLAKRGPLTIGAAQAMAFVRGLPGADRPDLQINFRPLSHRYDRNSRISPDPVPRLTAAVCYLQPRSRGRIALKSADPRQAPAIFANYLSAAPDEEAMLAGVKWVRRLFNSEPLKSHILVEDAPGDAAKSDSDLLGFIRETGQTMCHPVGTCKMGPDAMAVVDERLNVRGVRSLRVIDASVMPIIVSGNTAAATIMIAEKAADFIKADRSGRVAA
jgi:choline dehydrogenase